MIKKSSLCLTNQSFYPTPPHLVSDHYKSSAHSMCLLHLVRRGQPYCLLLIPLSSLSVWPWHYLLCMLRSKWGPGWLTLCRPGWLLHSPTPSQTWQAPLRETQQSKGKSRAGRPFKTYVYVAMHTTMETLGKGKSGLRSGNKRRKFGITASTLYALCSVDKYAQCVQCRGCKAHHLIAHCLFKAMCHSISGNWVYSDVFLVIFL